MNYIQLGEIQNYEIIFIQHSQDYNFYNSETLVDHFLLNVKSRIRRSAEGDFIIKCGFSLENVQPPPFKKDAPIVNSRYWSTEAQQSKSFSDYIYFNLREGILRRVINNGMTGSSWHFNRFLYINVNILHSVNQIFW